MRWRNLLTLGLVCGAFATVYANSPPVVSNVNASQRTDCSKKVDVYYNFSDADGDKCIVSVKVSDDGGATWDVNAVTFTGDIGGGITLGTSKHIIWDSIKDLPDANGTNYKVRVFADDGQVDDIPPEIGDVNIIDEYMGEVVPDQNGVYTVYGTVTIKAEVTDEQTCLSGVDKVVFYVEDANGITRYLNGTTDIPTQDDHNEPIGGTYTINWNTDIFSPGKYTLHIVAYDQAGNVKNISMKVWKRSISSLSPSVRWVDDLNYPISGGEGAMKRYGEYLCDEDADPLCYEPISMGNAFEYAKGEWNGASWEHVANLTPRVWAPGFYSSWGFYIYYVYVLRSCPYSNSTGYNPEQYSAQCWFQIQKPPGTPSLFRAYGSGYAENLWYKYPEDPVVGTDWTGTQWVPFVNEPPAWTQDWTDWKHGGMSGWQVVSSSLKIILFPK